MKSSLNLITTETFGNLPCNFYQDTNNEILLTREQIGIALEYSSPQKAIQKIHYRHKNRLDELCIRIVENRIPQNGGIGVNVETVYYTQKGIMEICRWSNKPKANLFMDWVWDIVEKYRSGELKTSTKESQELLTLTESISSMTHAITGIAENIANMQKEINSLKQQQPKREPVRHTYPSAWYKRITPKYKMLMEYFGCSRSELYSSIYKELEDTYNVDINQILEDYCYENYLSKEDCYPMEAIEHSPKLRDAVTLLIDTSLIKYGLQTEEEIKNYKRKTLFDTMPTSN